MSPRALRARDDRIAALACADVLTDAEHAELRRLERARDSLWQRLPRMVDAARHRLDHLTAYADEIGLGPC